MDSVAVFFAIDLAWYKNIVHGIPDLIAMACCGSYGSESGTWSLNMQLIYIYIYNMYSAFKDIRIVSRVYDDLLSICTSTCILFG